MKRLNITIDEDLYKKVKALSFFRNESISKIIRESLKAWLVLPMSLSTQKR